MTISNDLLDELLKGCKRPGDLLGDAGLMKELRTAERDQSTEAAALCCCGRRKEVVEPFPFCGSRKGVRICSVELYLRVRRACAEGMSQCKAAKTFDISRDTVRKMMSFSGPPGYRRQARVRRPRLDPFIPLIEGWLDADRQMPRKQRHTAKRVFDRLHEECGFTGGCTIIRDEGRQPATGSRARPTIRERDRRGQEVFVPLAHPPGHAQADFGEAIVRIGGVEQKAKVPAVKSLDSFNFAAIPKLNRMQVLELARCEWMGRRENVIALGPSGTGKTHVALGIGLAACQKGLSVGFTTAAALVSEMIEAR